MRRVMQIKQGSFFPDFPLFFPNICVFSLIVLALDSVFPDETPSPLIESLTQQTFTHPRICREIVIIFLYFYILPLLLCVVLVIGEMFEIPNVFASNLKK